MIKSNVCDLIELLSTMQLDAPSYVYILVSQIKINVGKEAEECEMPLYKL